VPYDSGLVLARDADALRVALELTGPAGGVETWAALLAVGRAGVAELVDGACGQARELARELAAGGYAVLNDVVLDRVVVGLGDSARVADAAARLRAAGVCEVVGTVWRGRPALCLRVGTGPVPDEALRRTVEAMAGAVSSRA
jgi:glutamate/tyrosine decarboxylase-like PLP-dependent enzyme